MKRFLMAGIAWVALLIGFAAPAWAAAQPKVRITGPAKELRQIVGKAFLIGVAASGFDEGWVAVQAPNSQYSAPMLCTKTNYLPYTPLEAGEHTITATVARVGDDHRYTSSVTITVYPTDGDERASWMVNLALDCVGSTDAEEYVRYTTLKSTDDWCAAFIGWCARQLAIPREVGLQSMYAALDIYGDTDEPILCATCQANRKARFRGRVLKKGEQPKPGDLVFFIWGSKQKAQLKAHPGYLEQWHGNASHVGLVTAVEGDDFQFVHGNIPMPHRLYGVVLNSSTDEKEGSTYADWVVAFARPAYDAQGEP